MANLCYCCSKRDYDNCCGPFIRGEKIPDTPEQLMRSRYSAYVLVEVEYLLKTIHPSSRHLYSKRAIRTWAEESTWISLEILAAKSNHVHFKATYLDTKKERCIHEEFSTFQNENGVWYFVDGE